LRFTTVAVIGPGWLLSSNKILPMLGTLGRTPRSARDPLVALAVCQVLMDPATCVTAAREAAGPRG